MFYINVLLNIERNTCVANQFNLFIPLPFAPSVYKKKIAELEGKKTNTQLTSRRLMAELDAFTTDFNVIMPQKEQYRSIIKQETISILPDKIQSEIHSVWNNDFSTATLSSFTDKQCNVMDKDAMRNTEERQKDEEEKEEKESGGRRR